MLITGILLALAGVLASIGRDRRCASCYRAWAIWPVRGRLNRWVFVCRQDFKAHRRRRRMVAR